MRLSFTQMVEEQKFAGESIWVVMEREVESEQRLMPVAEFVRFGMKSLTRMTT
jgi:hypothetical protein